MNLDQKEIRAIAHRGYPVKYPENTLSSFEAAYKLGFTYIELDVHLSKDGVPVIMHDTTIDRMSNGSGLLKDYTLKELKQFRIGETEDIPTLEEALLFAKDKIKVGVELKQEGDLYPGLEEAVLQVIRDTEMGDQVYINSFDHFSIAKMHSLSKDLSLGVIQSGATPAVFPFLKEIQATSLSVRVEFLSDEYVKMIEDAGIQVIAWPINNEWQFKRMLRYPSVISTTDELEKFRDFCKKYNLNQELINIQF